MNIHLKDRQLVITNTNTRNMAVAVVPFQFKPECKQSENDSEGPNGDPPDDNLGGMNAGVGRSERCLCANCIPMPTAIESVCCKATKHSFHR